MDVVIVRGGAGSVYLISLFIFIVRIKYHHYNLQYNENNVITISHELLIIYRYNVI